MHSKQTSKNPYTGVLFPPEAILTALPSLCFTRQKNQEWMHALVILKPSQVKGLGLNE